jgi:hypothetical protein
VHAIIEEAETRWGKSAWTWIALFMLAVLIVYPYSWLTGSESGALFARLASSSFPAWCAMLWYLGDRWSPSRRGAPLDASTA